MFLPIISKYIHIYIYFFECILINVFVKIMIGYSIFNSDKITTSKQKYIYPIGIGFRKRVKNVENSFYLHRIIICIRYITYLFL